MSMDAAIDFTEDEIREELVKLGYADVPTERLEQFKRDLEQLVRHERSKNSSSGTNDVSSTTDTDVGNHRSHITHQRVPLDETNYRQPTFGNHSTYDHAKFGKENQYSFAGPKQSDKEPVKSTVHIHMPRVAPDSATSMHSDTEPQYSQGVDISGRTYSYPRPGAGLRAEPVSIPGLSDTSMDSTTSTERRMIKRKVLRKRDGHSHIFDESVTESESDDMAGLRERLRCMPIDERDELRGQRPHSAYTYRPHSARDTPCYRLPEDYEGPKALIRPMTAEPHTRNIRKQDPVSRGQQYRESWGSQRAPGEKQHKGLRWGVREMMLYHDAVVVKKSAKVQQPNKYVVPSDKKRKNLRWQIRNDLAQGVVPPSIYD